MAKTGVHSRGQDTPVARSHSREQDGHTSPTLLGCPYERPEESEDCEPITGAKCSTVGNGS
jgi:hypothetical protein